LTLCSAPIGIPHRVAEDDWYEGMLIPKDSTIFVPSWALHHSERYGYEDPFAFKPERYANHPKLANDYAGNSDYNQRDKLPKTSMLDLLHSTNYRQHITMDMEQVGACVLGFIWPNGLSGE
jgi:hypothetical protein